MDVERFEWGGLGVCQRSFRLRYIVDVIFTPKNWVLLGGVALMFVQNL